MASAPRPPLEAVRDRLGRGIREMLAGTPDQVHEWDPAADRRFAPDSAMWAVHTDVAMLVGGLRALLLLDSVGVADQTGGAAEGIVAIV